MNTVNAKLMEMTRLSPEAYFSDAQQTFFDLQMRVNQELAALPAPETGLLLINGAPSLDLDCHEDLPALLLRYASGMRNWKVSNALNYYLLVQDLDSGLLKMQSLAEKGEERTRTPQPSASGEPPDSDTAEATGTSLRRYFLRELLKLDWRPSRLAFTVIDYDVASNTLPVTLTKANQAQPKPALPIAPASDFLKAVPAAASRSPGPESIGLSVESSSADQVILRGHLRAAVSSVPAARSSALANQADVILATLLLVALDQPPRPVNLSIPATLHGEPGSTQQLSADFLVDLVPLLGRKHEAGLYQVYLFVGLQTFGPLAVRVGG